MEDTSKFKNISTKVSPFVKERIARICRKKQMNEYEMLQMMCDCIVRYMDDRHNLTPELERMMSIFEHLEGWRNAFNLADHTAEADIREAFYVLSAKGKAGCRTILVERPWWDGIQKWKQTENIQDIFERFLNNLMPERYMKMRKLSIYLGIESRIDLLDYMLDRCIEEEMNAQYRADFEDAARAENNRPVAYGQRTRRSKHYDIDGRGAQQMIVFNNSPEDE